MRPLVFKPVVSAGDVVVSTSWEWRAVATSGRIVMSFDSKQGALQWRARHPEHPAHLERIFTRVERKVFDW